MNKLFAIILISFVAIITLFLCVAPPKQMKQVNIVDMSFTFKNEPQKAAPVVATNINNVNTVKTEQNAQIVNKNITQQTPAPVVTNKNVVKSTQTVKTVPQTVTKQVPVKTTSKPVTKTPQKVQVKPQTQPASKKPAAVTQPQNATPAKQPAVKQPAAQPQKPVEKAEVPAKQPQAPMPKATTQPAKKVLTQQEETIAWNAWRSRVDNEFVRLYNATKFSLPAGTRVTYSFNVDKFKNISNITIKTSPTKYQSAAQSAFVPMIQKMNHKSFLTFPEGTQRTWVVVERTKTIANSNYYTTPNDFSDYEKVKVTK